jgi:hypothetical protein
LLQVATKEEEVPSWIRSERERKLQAEEGSDLPFPVYLIGSALVAIAAVWQCPETLMHMLSRMACMICAGSGLQVGSIFEFANKNAIFGVVKPDNFLWAPILLFFAVTGLPSAGAPASVPVIAFHVCCVSMCTNSEGAVLQPSCSCEPSTQPTKKLSGRTSWTATEDSGGIVVFWWASCAVLCLRP